jgi:hypothetical protein
LKEERREGANDGAPTFEGDIKSLFRERDRARCLTSSTSGPFDDVKANADAILAAVRTSSMPCDTPWSTEKVDLLERWVDSGTPR